MNSKYGIPKEFHPLNQYYAKDISSETLFSHTNANEKGYIVSNYIFLETIKQLDQSKNHEHSLYVWDK